MKCQQALRRTRDLSPRRLRYLGRAAYELALARIRHARLSTSAIFEDLQSHYGSRPSESKVIDLADLAWSIAAVGRYVPWRSDCLVQAMAANRWLRHYGVQPQFFLGVKQEIGSGFAAHAWLQVGEVTITGGDASGFTPLLKPDPIPAPGPR